MLCIPAIREAIRLSSAKKIYVVNLRQQKLETVGLDISDHIRALLRHGFEPDLILADNEYMELGDAEELCHSFGGQLVICHLADNTGGLHDPELLADALERYGAFD